MLPLRFDFGNAEASAAVRCIVGKTFGAYHIALDGVRFDTRFVPGITGAKRDWRLIVFATVRSLSVRTIDVAEGNAIVAPQSIVSDQSEASRIATCGLTTELIAIRILPEALVDQSTSVRVQSISARTEAAFRELAAPTVAGKAEESYRAGRRLMAELVRDGVASEALLECEEPLARTLASRTVEAVFPLLSTLAKQPMMVDIMERAGIGERQVLRNILKVQSEFDLLDRGWREAIVRWRATAAVLLLSSPTLSMSEVASLAGYSSTKTMGHALGEAGLPQPSVIRAVLNGKAPSEPPPQA